MHEQSPKAQLLALARGHRFTEMVTLISRLGIADLLANGAADATTIAAATGTHGPTLYRLLRTLAAAGVLHEDDAGRFELTAAGVYLAADHPESVKSLVAVLDGDRPRAAWANLEHAVRTGENAFEGLYGEDVWAWRRREPEQGAVFNKAMAEMSFGVGAAVANAFAFDQRSVLADIAGGSGSMLAAILGAYPHLRGILFDQPAVVAQADELVRGGVVDRCELIGGSFFEAVPAGADVYMLKAILHDWEVPECIAILRSIGREIPDGGVLLVVERVIGPANEDLEGKLSDMQMLVMPGGRERTAEEWRALLEAGGFHLDEIRSMPVAWAAPGSRARQPNGIRRSGSRRSTR